MVEQPLSRTTRRIETLWLWRTPAEASKPYGHHRRLVTATAPASDGRHLAQEPVKADRRSPLSRARTGRYRNGVETRVSLALGVRGCPKSALPKSAKYFEILVSAAGFEPATHALKGSPTQFQTTTCTSSLFHARPNKINEMPTRHRSGCPEGARNPASRTMSLRFAGSCATRRNHVAVRDVINVALRSRVQGLAAVTKLCVSLRSPS